MPLAAAFRTSLYLSLALACAALAYSEGPFLPEMPVVAGFTGLLLLAAYWMEGRWALSLQAANIVGMFLAALLGIWVAYQFFRSGDGLMRQLPWPTSLLPYLGPVLMVLIPAKMLRPKHVGDYWAMQGLGLLAVALGCAMAGDAVFGLLLIAWLVAFVWNLAAFYFYRESSRGLAAAQSDLPKTERSISLFRLAGRWTAGVVGFGLLLFLITPRTGAGRWDLLSRVSMETGVTSESQVDLNRTGSLNINRELACEVYVETPDGQAKTDLSPTQRWRTWSLVRYENGRWARPGLTATINVAEPVEAPAASEFPRGSPGPNSQRPRLPDFGPEQYYLTFRLSPKIGFTPILADPVAWRPRPATSPIVLESGNMARAWQQYPDGSFTFAPHRALQGATYRQVTAPPVEPDLGPPMHLTRPPGLAYLPQSLPGFGLEPAVRPAREFQEVLTRVSNLASLEHWTEKLLDRLISEGKLPAEVHSDREGFTRVALPKHHEAIARALQAHLKTSGEYGYTLDLKRVDRRLDPIEDFLFNVKAGHCERFATALVLMLRSQGIPAQLVLGFKGFEPRGDGWYEIRQDHAHAWAEVLIARPAPPACLDLLASGASGPMMLRVSLQSRSGLIGGGGAAAVAPPSATGDLPPDYHWLTLDPTPDAPTEDPGLLEGLLGSGSKSQSFFRDFILGYDAQARARAFAAFVEQIETFGDDLAEGNLPTSLWVALGLVAAYPAWRSFRARRRRHSKPEPEEELNALRQAQIAPFHARLIEILIEHGFRPRPSQTAREFASFVSTQLAREPTTASVAHVPLDAADTYYRVRFGNESLEEPDRLALEAGLNRLDEALAKRQSAIRVMTNLQ
jgi:protein-glutamine gamma-glutamyltransferase